MLTSSADPIVGVSGYLVGNSLLSKLGSEQPINNNGNICETSSANIFWVKNQQIFTSDDQMGIVLGCIRKKNY